jgi:hypothetical protein
MSDIPHKCHCVSIATVLIVAFFMLYGVKLTVIILNVIMHSVMTPFKLSKFCKRLESGRLHPFLHILDYGDD